MLFESLSENVLTCPAVQLQRWRYRRHKLHEVMVEQRATNLEGSRHARTIDLCQNVVGKIRLNVYVLDPRQKMRRVCLSIVLAKDVRAVIGAKLAFEISRQNVWL